jgi:MFS family permease
MMGAVVASIFSGQYLSRVGRYKLLAILSSVLLTAGMVLLARMDLETTQARIIAYMVLIGLGLGALQPVFTLAVQNSAPREILGAATASVQFFRSIGSTLGVAVLGSVMLSLYKSGFHAAAPRNLPELALKPFDNPLLLVQIRPQLEAGFAKYPGGAQVLAQLMQNVRVSLAHGLQVIFWVGAAIMAVVLVLTFVLREVKLKSEQPVAPAVD